MTNKDLYGKWTSQEPVGLTEEQLDSAYSSVKGKIRRAESASLAIKLSEELRVRRQKRIIRILSAAVAAACLILPVVIVNVSRHSYEKGLSAQVNDETPQMLEYSANAGEMRHVLLPDSTSVTLNAGTVLICPAEFIGGKRGVYLNGEATFDVTRNEKKPFVVSTSVMDITVLGTKFNVSSYSDDENVTATLCRGSISALTKNAEEPVVLTPGQRFVVERSSGNSFVENVNADEDVAWETGQLCFRSKSIHEIVKIIERRYAVRIYVTTGKYDNDLITAKFIQGATLDDLMFALCKLIPGMSYRKVNANIYIR